MNNNNINNTNKEEKESMGKGNIMLLKTKALGRYIRSGLQVKDLMFFKDREMTKLKSYIVFYMMMILKLH